MAKRKNNNISTRKKFRVASLFDWIPGTLVQSFSWIVLFLLIVGIGLGVKELVYADPLLSLKSIQVFPPDALPVSKVEALQRAWLGKNTPQINLKQIARDIEMDHRVLSADVRRVLPNRLEIQVNRREAFAYVHFGRNGKWAVVSRDAIVMDVVPHPLEGLYQVQDEKLSSTTPKFGTRLSRNMLNLVKVTDAFSKHPISKTEKISSIVMLPNDSATLVFGDLSVKVNLNDAAPEQAFSKYQYLLETETRAVIEYVDLRYNRVILKRKTEPVAKKKKQR